MIAPDGSYVVGPVRCEPFTLFADLDLARVGSGRMYLDTNGHYARPDGFELRVDTRRRLGVHFVEP